MLSVKKKSTAVSLTFECNFRGILPKWITTGSQWKTRLIMKLSTATREYESLVKINDLCFSRMILKPFDIPWPPDQAKIVKYMEKMQLNYPQATAVYRSVVQSHGFLLIQGPPGTGKTKTILGMTGALLGSRGTAITIPKNISTSKQSYTRKKILICAPSNAAVDEICRRLLGGVLNSHGIIYRPQILRIGNEVGISPDCLEVSLNNKIEQTLLSEIKNISVQREALQGLEKKMKSFMVNPSNYTDKINQTRRAILSLKKAINEAGSIEVQKKKLYSSFVLESEILLCTLSGSGHESLSSVSGLEFEATIIDEACQVM